MKYKGIVYKEENGTFWVDFPDIEGCHTQGDTMEELIKNAQEVVELCMEDYKELPASTVHSLIEVEIDEQKNNPA